jgi:twitching motility protein PilT
MSGTAHPATPSAPVGGGLLSGTGRSQTKLEVDKLFRICVKQGGSDLHLKTGKPPMIRYKGDIRQLDLPPLSARDMEKLLLPMLNERLKQIFEVDGGADFAHVVEMEDGQTRRFRVNMLKQRGDLGLVARLVNATIPTFDKLFLPPVLGEICQHHQGLIIFAGITGSGKTTSIGSMLNYINSFRRCHILTIEDPIEFVYTDDKAVINQREVGIDVASWQVALKHAMREDPDVMLVGEMRDHETFEAAVHAAETGHLVFGTIHANTAPSTIGRILDLFPIDMHNAIRQTLAFNLKAIVAQKLIKTTEEMQAKGIFRVPINEVLIINPSARKAISEGLDARLADIIKISEQEGMQDFTKALKDRVEADMITRESAFEVAPNPDALKMALKGIKLPVSGLA